MSLAAGTRLGSYEILAPIGAGGMGEVYRAKDTKLNRDVAIKVLPESFALDADRVARFTREAQVLASLNHPNIAAIYGIETNALVMELVEGEDLSAIIARGPIALADAVALAKQIADALEAAHEQGIVHRDLKPQNIKVRADGTVKVLDFGLAKAMDPTGPSGVNVANSPTMTANATAMGMVIGTAAYMSPEQARGRAVDRRADIWAFGVVLYEMLTGTRAFEGEDISITLANVLKDDVKWHDLPADAPAALQRLLRRCLERDPKKRLSWIGEAKVMLDEPAVAATSPDAAPRASSLLWQLAAAVFLLTTIGAAAAWYRAETVAPEVSRFWILPPDGTTFTSGNVRGATVPSLSPDGRTIAFTAADAAGARMLWVRAIDSLTSHAIAGTDGAGYPFWSPDGKDIGYTITGKLMRVPAAGGMSTMICALHAGIFSRGGSWAPNGVVIFNNGPAALSRAPATGGTAAAMGAMGESESGRQFPHFLPDGRHYLYSGSDRDGPGVFAGVLDSNETSLVVHADTGAVYDRASRRILFVRQGRLLAQPFDAGTRTASGEAVPVAEGVESAAVPGLVAFSVSESGVLVYGAGAATEPGTELAWFDRRGMATSSLGPTALYRGMTVSPDGLRLAEHRHDADGGDIYVTDLAGKRSMRLTFDAKQENTSPIWSPRGDRIAYGSIRAGVAGIYAKAADNPGVEEQLYIENGSRFVVPFGWSADGRSILFGRTVPGAGRDLWRLSLADRKAVPALNSPASASTGQKTFGQISPDGRWIAYASNETGVNEIYVEPASGTAGKWPISTDGGNTPLWRGDSRELFYLSKGKVVAVTVTAKGATFVPADPLPLFDVPLVRAGNGHTDFYPYAVSIDGEHFLFPRGNADASLPALSSPLAVVLNWIEGIKK
jgi:Tol biopolymer transport system component